MSKKKNIGGYGKRMYKTNKICPTCGSSLYITRLEEKYFCRKCWEYKEPKKDIKKKR